MNSNEYKGIFWLVDALGIEIDELTHEEIDQLRPEACAWLGANSTIYYHKIHDACVYRVNDDALIPQ